MSKYILAGAIKGMFMSKTGQMIFTTQTTQENTFSISVDSEDIRGGLANPLLGRYFYNSIMEASITDALFSLDYLASVVGGEVTVGGDAITDETVTVTTANTITVTGTPVDWQGVGTIGWYRTPDSDTYTTITFTGKNATVANLPVGTTVCVQYIATNDALKEFTVPSSIIPKEGVYIVKGALFSAGSEGNTQSSQVGELIVTVPRFQLSGSTEISMSSSGASTTTLNGSALASYSGSTNSCSDIGKYATIQEVIYGANWYDSLVAMAVNDADFTMNANDTKTLEVIGIYEGGSTGVIDNANLTFTSGTQATATVANTGIVTAVASGTSNIKIVATGKTEIEAIATVTVS